MGALINISVTVFPLTTGAQPRAHLVISEVHVSIHFLYQMPSAGIWRYMRFLFCPQKAHSAIHLATNIKLVPRQAYGVALASFLPNTAPAYIVGFCWFGFTSGGKKKSVKLLPICNARSPVPTRGTCSSWTPDASKAASGQHQVLSDPGPTLQTTGAQGGGVADPGVEIQQFDSKGKPRRCFLRERLTQGSD